MDIRVWILAWLCQVLGSLGLLNLENEKLICMYIECVAVYLCFHNTSMVCKVYTLLEELFIRIDCANAIKYCEKCLELAVQHNNKKIEGMVNMHLGLLHLISDNFHKALDHGNKCLDIAREIEDEVLEAVAYFVIGRAYNKLCEYTKAMECYNKCLNIKSIESNKDYKRIAYHGLGKCHYELRNYKEAIEFYEVSLSISTELDHKTDIIIVNTYHDLGCAYTEINNLDKALDCFQKQLSIALEIQDKQQEGRAYLGIGSIYSDQDQYDEAIKYTEKQVEIAQQIGMKNDESDGYLELGNIFCCMSNNNKAVEYYHKALDIYEMTGNKAKVKEVCINLGGISLSMGDYGNAIRYYEKDIKILLKRVDKEHEVLSLVCLGILFYRLGRNREAIAYFLRGHDIAMNMKADHVGRETQVTSLSVLGKAYYAIGATKKAEECFEKQLELSIMIENGNLKLEFEASAYNGLAKILSSKGKCQDAMHYLEKSLEIAVKLNNKVIEGNALLQLGDCYLLFKNYSEAVCHYEKALTLVKDSKSKYNETQANLRFGMLYVELATLDVALTEKTEDDEYYQKSKMYLKEAIEGSDWMLQHLQADHDDFKISLFNTFTDAYNILTEVLIQTQQTEEALLVSERGRGRSLTDLLISKYFISHKDATALASPLSTYDEIQAFLQRSKLCILFYTMAHSYIIWVLFHNKLVCCQIHETEELRQTLHKSSLLLNNQSILWSANLCEAYIKILIDEAYSALGVTEASMSCEDRSLDGYRTRGVSDENHCTQTATVGPDTAAPSNQTEQHDSSSGRSSEATNVQDNRHPLEKLFDILIAPIQSSLTQDEIVIIPQGPLYLVPFAVLKDAKNQQFLCETKRIRLAPSISALKMWQECPEDYHCEKGALVIGNPTVGKVMFKGEERDFKPLPRAQQEAESIARRLRVTALTGSQATKEEVKSRLAKGVAVIHIAAHGDSENGEIALAPSKSATEKGTPEEEDYLLTMSEVQQIGIRAKLVVLSCCHSGRGKIEPEGVVGMSRAFLAAGARAVIASLWATNDFVTASFMVSLYSYLKRGHSASASLQEAMEDIRREDNGRYCHGKYWAPFFLIGDDVTIIKTD